MTTDPSKRLDVAIVGAGVVGLAFALALRAELGPALRLAVFDPTLGAAPRADVRTAMIAADARRFLAGLGAWPDQAEPVLGLRITDSRLDDAIRPTFLELGEPTAEGAPFAHMAFDADLRAGLLSQARAAGLELVPDRIDGQSETPGGIDLTLASGGRRSARVLVAADGARSPTRGAANIAVNAFAYDQTALIATVAFEVPHGGIAVQHFLPGGPFALLPLSQNRASLVWSERRAVAETMTAKDDAAFLAEVERRAGPDFGALALAGPRAAYPLRFLLARSFVGSRVALVGDAGHVVHPLAGQGLNLGLRDAMALAGLLAEAARRGDDMGAAATLARYEGARRFEVAALAAATDGLYRLFGTGASRTARDVGMGLVDRAPGLKRRIVQAAAGL